MRVFDFFSVAEYRLLKTMVYIRQMDLQGNFWDGELEEGVILKLSHR